MRRKVSRPFTAWGGPGDVKRVLVCLSARGYCCRFVGGWVLPPVTQHTPQRMYITMLWFAPLGSSFDFHTPGFIRLLCRPPLVMDTAAADWGSGWRFVGRICRRMICIIYI